MRSFTTALVVIACLTFGPLAMSFAAPEWTKKAGLDFWNLDEEKNHFEAVQEEAQRLDAVSERLAVRLAVSERLASGLCEDRITLDEALDELRALGQDDPNWFAGLRSSYCLYGHLPQTATDRDVLARYLRGTIEGMQPVALQLGDFSRAAFICERLVRLDEEVRFRSAP